MVNVHIVIQIQILTRYLIITKPATIEYLFMFEICIHYCTTWRSGSSLIAPQLQPQLQLQHKRGRRNRVLSNWSRGVSLQHRGRPRSISISEPTVLIISVSSHEITLISTVGSFILLTGLELCWFDLLLISMVSNFASAARIQSSCNYFILKCKKCKVSMSVVVTLLVLVYWCWLSF